MGRYPIGEKAMTNAEKQKRYRQKLAEGRRIEVTRTMEITTEQLNARFRIRQLEYLEKVDDQEDEDIEQLKLDFQKLKEENRKLKRLKGK